MNSKQTWSLADSYRQFEAKFRTLMIEETLSATNFRFVAKIHRKSVLCSDEMSLNRPRTFDRIFVRTFDERSLEQITKFAEFRLHYFCTILYVSNHALEFSASFLSINVTSCLPFELNEDCITIKYITWHSVKLPVIPRIQTFTLLRGGQSRVIRAAKLPGRYLEMLPPVR